MTESRAAGEEIPVAWIRPGEDTLVQPETYARLSAEVRKEFRPLVYGDVARPTPAAAADYDAHQANGLAWAVSCWQAEVSRRPLVNVHRRTLDDTWRQVIRYFGGDPVKLLGPAHDTLHMQAQEDRAWKP